MFTDEFGAIQRINPFRLIRIREAAERRRMIIGSYLTDALAEQPGLEQIWLISVDDEGTPRARSCCYYGDDAEGSSYLRELLLAMLRANKGQFVIVHYGSGDSAEREISALLVYKALRNIEGMVRFALIDYFVASRISDQHMRFESLNDC